MNAQKTVRYTGLIVPYLQDMHDYPLSAVHEKIISWCHGYGIPVIDLLSSFQQLPPNVLDGYRTDPIHPNAAGHRMIAEVVARQFQ